MEQRLIACAVRMMENEIERIDIEIKKDVDALLERIEGFHNWERWKPSEGMKVVRRKGAGA